jgi:hypothetical protein
MMSNLKARHTFKLWHLEYQVVTCDSDIMALDDAAVMHTANNILCGIMFLLFRSSIQSLTKLMFKLAYTTDNFDRWRKYLGVMA